MGPDARAADVVLTPRQVGRLLATSGLAAWVLAPSDPALAGRCSAQADAVERALAAAPHDDVRVPAAALRVLVVCWQVAQDVLATRTGVDRAEQRRTDQALTQLRARCAELEGLLAA